ncbi:MAG TPA: malate dehydrogenase [Planctomycetia bacterium]|nr:malate dehydrogenase [Planctomycetia bacterium]
MRPKITIVGAGNVGGTAAQRLAEKEVGDIVLVDVAEGIPQGKSLDLLEAGPICGYDTNIIGTNTYDETEGSSICVITAGRARKPGMTRSDLLENNVNVVKSVVEELVKRSPETILLLVTNPLDAMAYVAYKVSGFPKERVIGLAGVLDTSRFATFISMELGVSVENVQAMLIGGHSDPLPLARYTTVAGVPITELLSKERIDALIKRTIHGGAEIVHLLKTGSAYFAPSAAITEMVTAILMDKKKILPSTVLCQGAYGLKDIFIGVPAKLGSKGVEGIIELHLTEEEGNLLRKSAQEVKAECSEVDRLIK